MLFVQCDDVVEELATAASDPALRDSILPGCLNTRALRFQTSCLEQRADFAIELCITIQNHVPGRTGFRKGLAQLLHDPIGSRMTGDVEMQDSAAPVFDNEEAVQEFEGQCGHGKEIDGDDCLAMIGEESKPALAS